VNKKTSSEVAKEADSMRLMAEQCANRLRLYGCEGCPINQEQLGTFVTKNPKYGNCLLKIRIERTGKEFAKLFFEELNSV